jgi:lambda family phage tail tape measure protein
MATIGSLSVKLGLVTVEWDQATDKAKKQAKDLQTAFNNLGGPLKNLQGLFRSVGGASGLATIGFGALMVSTAQFANQIKDLSTAYDISIGKTLQFKNALEQSGVSAENSGKMIANLFAKIGGAQAGTDKEALRIFEDLGISFKELQALQPEKAVNRIFDALANGSQNTFERVKAVRTLLGKTGLQADVKGINELLQMSTEKFDKYGASLARFAEFNDQLGITMQNLKVAFADLMAPFLSKDMTISVDTFKVALGAIGGYVVLNAIGNTITALKELKNVLVGLQAAAVSFSISLALSSLLARIPQLYVLYSILHSADLNEGASPNDQAIIDAEEKKKKNGKGKSIPSVLALQEQIAYTKQLIEFEKIRGQMQRDALDNSDYQNKSDEINLAYKEKVAEIGNRLSLALNKDGVLQVEKDELWAKANAEIALAYEKQIQALDTLNAEQSKSFRLANLQLEMQQQMQRLDEKSLELEGEKYKLNEFEYASRKEELEFYKQMLVLQQQIEKIKAERKNGEFSTDQQNQVTLLNDQIKALETLHELTVRNRDAEEQRRASFTEGWAEAYRKYARDATNAADIGRQAFETFSKGLEDMLTEFIKTGKISFKDFANMIISEIARMQAKAMASSIMGLFGGGSGGGIGGFISSIFGGGGGGGGFSGGIVLTGIANPIIGGGGGLFADGGDPPINKASIVGENGPELFIPKASGTIVPNSSLSSSMANQPQIVYNGPYIQNMSAIDTQSATQFLATNKSAVWAANQSAQRSLPQGR